MVATVPLPAVLANRARLLILIATNFFGQNTAAIAQTELEYVEMWAQDVAAMVGYHAGPKRWWRRCRRSPRRPQVSAARRPQAWRAWPTW